jgi:hypothetical protein
MKVVWLAKKYLGHLHCFRDGKCFRFKITYIEREITSKFFKIWEILLYFDAFYLYGSIVIIIIIIVVGGGRIWLFNFT